MRKPAPEEPRSETLGYIGVDGPNLYKSIFTRNADMARFFDDNHNAAALVKKLVHLIISVAESWHYPCEKIVFDVRAMRGSKDGEYLLIKLKKK